TACRKTDRLIVLRKNLTREKGDQRLVDEIRYSFFITNEGVEESPACVLAGNGRCNQENPLAQLQGGVRDLRAPVDSPASNWAYLVMTALAWNLKAWWALTLPEEPGRWPERHREEKRWVLGLEFKTFVNALVRLPWPRCARWAWPSRTGSWSRPRR